MAKLQPETKRWVKRTVLRRKTQRRAIHLPIKSFVAAISVLILALSQGGPYGPVVDKILSQFCAMSCPRPMSSAVTGGQK